MPIFFQLLNSMQFFCGVNKVFCTVSFIIITNEGYGCVLFFNKSLTNVSYHLYLAHTSYLVLYALKLM